MLFRLLCFCLLIDFVKGNKWNSPPGEMGRFGSLKVPSTVPSQLGPNRSVGSGGGGPRINSRNNVIPVAILDNVENGGARDAGERGVGRREGRVGGRKVEDK